jgi:hypothetical protein
MTAADELLELRTGDARGGLLVDAPTVVAKSVALTLAEGELLKLVDTLMGSLIVGAVDNGRQPGFNSENSLKSELKY